MYTDGGRLSAGVSRWMQDRRCVLRIPVRILLACTPRSGLDPSRRGRCWCGLGDNAWEDSVAIGLFLTHRMSLKMLVCCEIERKWIHCLVLVLFCCGPRCWHGHRCYLGQWGKQTACRRSKMPRDSVGCWRRCRECFGWVLVLALWLDSFSCHMGWRHGERCLRFLDLTECRQSGEDMGQIRICRCRNKKGRVLFFLFVLIALLDLLVRPMFPRR